MDSAVKALELRQMLTIEAWKRITAGLVKPWAEDACMLDLWFDSTQSQSEYRRRWGRGATSVRAFIAQFDTADIPHREIGRQPVPKPSRTGLGPVEVKSLPGFETEETGNLDPSKNRLGPVSDGLNDDFENVTRLSYICSSTKNNISPNSNKFGITSPQKAIDELKKQVDTLLESVKANFKTRGTTWYLTDNKRKATLAACRKKGQSFADVEAVLLWWTTSNHPTACYLREQKYGLSTLFRPSKFPAYLELAQDEEAVQVATPDRRTMTDEEEAEALEAMKALGVFDAS